MTTTQVPGNDATTYMVDAWQRAILTLDVLRERGNQYLEHERSGSPPVLVFDSEIVVDGRSLEKPGELCADAHQAARGPSGDRSEDASFRGHRPARRPRPRRSAASRWTAEIGIALKFGHPCYFVTFFPHPLPGQTGSSRCARPRVAFMRKLRELHRGRGQQAFRHRQLPGRVGCS